MKTLKVAVPPGIGDISWVYSKFSQVEGIDLEFHICGDGYKRALPYVELLPKVKKAIYTNMTYHEMKGKPQLSYDEIVNSDEVLMLEANTHLEAGNRIEDYLPGFPTDYYYDINIPKYAVKNMDDKLKNKEQLIGIFMANKNTSINWNGWTPEEWLLCIKLLHEFYPQATFVLIGAGWDSNMKDYLAPYLDMNKIDYIDLIARTDFGEALAVLKKLNLFISFASGLSVLSINTKTPVIMLYPDILETMMYTWAPSESITKSMYAAALWDRPTNILKNHKDFIAKSMKGRCE